MHAIPASAPNARRLGMFRRGRAGPETLIERVADALAERGRLSGAEVGALIGGGSTPATAAGSSALVPHGEPRTAPRPGRGVRGRAGERRVGTERAERWGTDA